MNLNSSIKKSKNNRSTHIMRIGSVPTAQRPGMGLAVQKLMEMDDFTNSLITYKQDETYLLTEDMLDRAYFLTFDNPTMPKARKGIRFAILQIARSWKLLSFAISAMMIISKEKPSILHIHSPLHFLILQWARLRGITIFLTFHGTDFVRIRDSKLYQMLLTGVDNICCVSSRQKDILQKIFPTSKVSLVSNGVDINEFDTCLDYNSHDVIIAVGTLRWHKGFDRLIEAFNGIADRYPSWQLRIIGEGPERKKLENLISKYNLHGRVKIVGALNREKLCIELARSKIYALSSVTEGLPKALLEAMAARCACLAFDVGDVDRVLSGHGIVVDNGDLTMFTDAVDRLMRDDSLRDSLSSLAHKRAAQFSWHEYLRTHRILYNEALF